MLFRSDRGWNAELVGNEFEWRDVVIGSIELFRFDRRIDCMADDISPES